MIGWIIFGALALVVLAAFIETFRREDPMPDAPYPDGWCYQCRRHPAWPEETCKGCGTEQPPFNP